MTTQLTERYGADHSSSSDVARRLLVVWRNPSTRRFATVARLDQLEDGRFAFSYSDKAECEEGFFPLDEYPDIRATYVSETLPVFFANRVMSVGRASYKEYLGRLGLASLSSSEVPMEVLIRTGGGRATDTFHIVEAPVDEADRFESRFFVSGIGHLAGAPDRVRQLRAGVNLQLRAEPTNEINSRAVLIDVEAEEPIGWVPDWLCDQVRTLMDEGFELRASVDQINVEAPLRLQVLCRIEAVRTKSNTATRAS
jgi:hypothetical protein